MSEIVKEMKFDNKVIVVTGGGVDKGTDEVGFGFKTAQDLFEKGANVAILGRKIERLRNAMQEIVGSNLDERFSIYECDISKREKVKEVFKLIKQTHGLVYGLVNNAGINPSHTGTVDTSAESFYKTFRTNSWGAFNCSRAAIPQMTEAGEGSIVNVSSIGAGEPFPDMAAYCASKAAMESQGKSDAKNHIKDGIRSNIIRPGRARTPLTAEFLDNHPDRLRTVLEDQPFGGLVTPEQVSQGIQRLLDPESDYNGEILEVANRHQQVGGKQILTIGEISYKLKPEERMSSTPPPEK